MNVASHRVSARSYSFDENILGLSEHVKHTLTSRKLTPVALSLHMEAAERLLLAAKLVSWKNRHFDQNRVTNNSEFIALLVLSKSRVMSLPKYSPAASFLDNFIVIRANYILERTIAACTSFYRKT